MMTRYFPVPIRHDRSAIGIVAHGGGSREITAGSACFPAGLRFFPTAGRPKGVDRTHPDLADHIWTNLGEIPDNGIDDDGNGYVDDTWGWDFCEDDNVPDSGAPGTQVAGQVAGDGTDGAVTGMAPDAELMVLGINCSPPDSIGWEASDYAIANGAHIITESYIWPWTVDTPDFEGWRRQTDAQLAAGIIHASAAGNDGEHPIPAIPCNVSAPANAPPGDAGHDTATLYRIERATSPAGPFIEAGPATETRWLDVDAVAADDTYYYRVRAENAGGSETP